MSHERILFTVWEGQRKIRGSDMELVEVDATIRTVFEKQRGVRSVTVAFDRFQQCWQRVALGSLPAEGEQT